MKMIAFVTMFLVLILFPVVSIVAQDLPLEMRYEAQKIYVEDDSIMVSSSHYIPALSVYIPEVYVANVQKAWEKKIRKATKSKFAHQHNVFFLSQTLVKVISQDPLNVYSSYAQQNKVVKLTAGFELDSGFLSRSFMPDNYTNARSFVKTFGKEQYRASINRLLQTQRKNMRALQQDMNNLFNKNKRLKSSIKKHEMGISDLEENIKEHQTQAEMKAEEISVSTQALASYSGELRKEKEKTLKKLKQERKQLKTKAKRMAAKITRYETDIKKANHEIGINLAEQKEQKKRIKKQRLVVENLTNVLNAIDQQ